MLPNFTTFECGVWRLPCQAELLGARRLMSWQLGVSLGAWSAEAGAAQVRKTAGLPGAAASLSRIPPKWH